MTHLLQVQLLVDDEKRMRSLGGLLAKFCQLGMVIFLQGELGAGKTTLIRGFLNELGYKDIVKSPTYTLVESYLINQYHVYHFDLYRLHSPEELLEIGLRDYLKNDSICLIEWPEKAGDILPLATLYCTIEVPKNGMRRIVTLSAKTPIGQQLLKNIQDTMDLR